MSASAAGGSGSWVRREALAAEDPQVLLARVGARVVEARARRGMLAADVAKRAGTEPLLVEGIEAGAVSSLRVTSLFRIAIVLRVDLAELVVAAGISPLDSSPSYVRRGDG